MRKLKVQRVYLFLPIFLMAGSFLRFDKGPESLKNTGYYTYSEQKFYHKDFPVNDIAFGYPKYVYKNMSMFVNTATIYRRGEISELAYELNPDIPKIITRTPLFGVLPLQEYIKQSSNEAFLVIHKGKIIYEHYDKMNEHQYHSWMSMSKTLVGWAAQYLESKGLIDYNKTVGDYLDLYKDAAYGRVIIRNLLNMSSGIFANDDFFSFLAPYIRFTKTMFAPGFQKDMRILPSVKPQGAEYIYTTLDSLVMTMIIEKVSQQPLCDFLTENLWFQLGAEHDARLGIFGVSMGLGTPIGGGTGLMMSSLRDLGRYGLIYTPSGRALYGEDLVSEHFFDYIKDPNGKPNNEQYLKLRTDPKDFDPQDVGFGVGDIPRYGANQWDMVFPDGDFFKFGLNAQGLYVSPSKDLVVAYFGFDDKPAQYPQAYARAIARYIVDHNLNQHLTDKDHSWAQEQNNDDTP